MNYPYLTNLVVLVPEE